MVIRLDENYNAMTSTALLGYVGETNARPVSVEGLTVDGADRYVLTIDYGDGTVYEVDITGGQWTPTADILRVARNVSCQISARKYDNGNYTLVKKSKIFSLRIGQALSDGVAPIPSPSVAADALDRMTALGDRITADVQTAVTAAETATTASENAEKSATTAGVSADTAEQAASRAETAKTAAETSATQAETAKQGAETARTEAVTAQNNAKISAAQASASAQQTTADKTATAGYAQTAKTNSDSTAADRQAVQTLAEQVTADKTTVADHAAQVAEDRTAAETAAQTAQAVADSLPDDYTTAVGKIAENTAEIANVKLTDKELQRRVNALYDIGQGITHRFETDSDTAYQKTVPTGAKLMSVKSIGGHSEVIDGEIVSAGTESIIEQGRNLLDENAPSEKLNYDKDNNVIVVNNSWNTKFVECPQNAKNLTLKVPSTKKYNDMIYTFFSRGKSIGDDVIAYKHVPFYKDTESVETISIPSGAKYFAVSLWHTFPFFDGIQVELGDTPTAYAPYHRNTYPIPEAIRNLPGYGWSAGTARNYVDYENKKYYQCVGSVDLGTLNFKLNVTSGVGQHFYAFVKHLNFKYLGVFATTVYNVLCSKYRTAPRSQNVFVDKTLTIDGATVVTQIQVKDSAYTDATAFKQAMSGVMLYYELETPIVTDISNLIPDDFLRNIEVESGGSVTFKNSNGDSYRIPVPNEEEYVVKLSEVGGTT